MLLEDGLVVVDAYLDGARLHLDRVDLTLTTRSAAADTAFHRVSASQRVRPASVGLERARTYLRAAQQTIGDVADDVALGFVDRAGEDLRLLERLCAMVDELCGLAARTLAATVRTLPRRGSRAAACRRT
jgi:phosphate uptake regulator